LMWLPDTLDSTRQNPKKTKQADLMPTDIIAG